MPTEKETTETLLERSQRILGLSLDSPDPDEQSALSSTSTGSNNRRKAQVSQAQRTHRRRTQRYIRELEAEVLRVRFRERSALLRVSTLENQLISNNLDPHPAISIETTAGTPPPPGPSAAQSSTSPDLEDHTISRASSLNLATSVSPRPSTSASTIQELDTDIDVDLGPLNLAHPAYSPAAETLTPSPAFLNAIPGQINRARNLRASIRIHDEPAPEFVVLDAHTASEFVLQLERPCLSHIRYAVEQGVHRTQSGQWEDTTTTGGRRGPEHVLTATWGLLEPEIQMRHGPRPSAGPGSGSRSGKSRETQAQQQRREQGPGTAQGPADEQTRLEMHPQQQIDALLAASARLDLEFELTPVQVWQRIVQTANASRVQTGFLEDLTDAFRTYSFCNSYGSVCHKDVVEVVLRTFFPGYISGIDQAMESPQG